MRITLLSLRKISFDSWGVLKPNSFKTETICSATLGSIAIHNIHIICSSWIAMITNRIPTNYSTTMH